MAITTTSRVIIDGPRNLIMQLTGISDGEGQETNVVKVDVGALNPPCDRVRIQRITYDISYAGKVQLAWDALDPVVFAYLDLSEDIDYCRAPLQNVEALGATGNILLSTIGFELNSSYTILIEMKKKFWGASKKAAA